MFDVSVPQHPYISGPQDYHEASKLIECYGAEAVIEAAARARRCRNLGNHINFCRWRQIERLIEMLGDDRAMGTRH
ncbi:hypothetical protein GCM10023219_00360 [Stakelama sediminis]|uniref:Uncharacterized protein n=1 Tax=Stakelama sediminis TaxID=463200 RepID=A0A840Z173_9SPHN|nr:hypothetical protein [Stakelama sediminis]MBB5719527.1 hypothetical protein [Stakelama sediminis]